MTTAHAPLPEGNPTMTDNFAEDLSFPWGGYWVGFASRLMPGDGVRFDRDDPTCWLVHEVNVRGDGKVDLLLTNRTVHVANVFADALHRPIEGMADDPQPHLRTLTCDQQVWIRL